MRRRFGQLILIGAVLGAALFIYARWIEPKTLSVHQLMIGEGDQETRLLLISDLHVGGVHVGPDRVIQIVDQINALTPDFVIMPGDFIDGHKPNFQRTAAENATIQQALSHLAAINAPMITSLGNHDSWYGKGHVATMLAELDITVLDNSARRETGLCFVGLADHDTDQPSVTAFDACDAADARVALMHSPDSRRFLPRDLNLAVAGHTHGGQVNLPVIGRRVTSTRCGEPCAYGLINEEPPIFVSAGIGTSILPLRFRSPPGIVLITLRYSRKTPDSDQPQTL